MNVFENFIPFNKIDMFDPQLMLNNMSKFYNYNAKVYSKFSRVNETIVNFVRSRIGNYTYAFTAGLEEKRKRRDRDYSTEDIFWWNNYSGFIDIRRSRELLSTLDNYFRNQWIAGNILVTSKYKSHTFNYVNKFINDIDLFRVINIRHMTKSLITLYDYKYIHDHPEKLNKYMDYPGYRVKNIEEKIEKILFFNIGDNIYPNYGRILNKWSSTIREAEYSSKEMHDLLQNILVKYDLKLSYSKSTIMPRDLEGFCAHNMISIKSIYDIDILNVEDLLGIYIIRKLRDFNNIMYKKYGFDRETMYYLIYNVLRIIHKWVEEDKGYCAKNRALKDILLNSMPDYIQYIESMINYNRGMGAEYNSCANITAMPKFITSNMISSSAYLDATIINLAMGYIEYINDIVALKFNIDNLFRKAEESGIVDDYEYGFKEY